MAEFERAGFDLKRLKSQLKSFIKNALIELTFWSILPIIVVFEMTRVFEATVLTGTSTVSVSSGLRESVLLGTLVVVETEVVLMGVEVFDTTEVVVFVVTGSSSGKVIGNLLAPKLLS